MWLPTHGTDWKVYESEIYYDFEGIELSTQLQAQTFTSGVSGKNSAAFKKGTLQMYLWRILDKEVPPRGQGLETKENKQQGTSYQGEESGSNQGRELHNAHSTKFQSCKEDWWLCISKSFLSWIGVFIAIICSQSTIIIWVYMLMALVCLFHVGRLWIGTSIWTSSGCGILHGTLVCFPWEGNECFPYVRRKEKNRYLVIRRADCGRDLYVLTKIRSLFLQST